MDAFDTDILILGAGGAGLCAAWHLVLHYVRGSPRLDRTEEGVLM